MVIEILQDVNTTYARVNEEDKADFISFLSKMLTGKNFSPPSPTWYDRGLLYKSAQGLQVINPIVRAVLWEYYIRSLKIQIVNERPTGSVIGSNLESAVSVGLAQAARTIHPFQIESSEGNLTPWSLPKVDRIVRFSSSLQADNDQPTRNPIVQDKCWMWIPISETHPSFDYILQDFEAKRIIFIQTSTRAPSKGASKVLKAFKKPMIPKSPTPDTDMRNLMEKELELLTQEKGWSATYKDGILFAKHPQPEWSVHFLFVTSVSEKKVKKDKYEIRNMAIIGKEQLPRLGVYYYY